MLEHSRRVRLARLVISDRKTFWTAPNGESLKVSIKRIHRKNARVILPNGEETIVPVSQLDLTGRWKAKYLNDSAARVFS